MYRKSAFKIASGIFMRKNSYLSAVKSFYESGRFTYKGFCFKLLDKSDCPTSVCDDYLDARKDRRASHPEQGHCQHQGHDRGSRRNIQHSQTGKTKERKTDQEKGSRHVPGTQTHNIVMVFS